MRYSQYPVCSDSSWAFFVIYASLLGWTAALLALASGSEVATELISRLCSGVLLTG